MRIASYASFILLSLSSCSNQDSKDRRVISKWNFHQSSASHCDDDQSNSPSTCVFHYKGTRYLRGTSFIYDTIGNIDSIYSYHVPLGLNTYSIEQYGRYMMSLDTSGFKELQQIKVVWNDSLGKIIDNGKVVDDAVIEENQAILQKGRNLTFYKFSKP